MSDTRSDSRYDLRTRGSTIPIRPRTARASSLQEPQVSNQQGANPPRDTEPTSHKELLHPADPEIQLPPLRPIGPAVRAEEDLPQGLQAFVTTELNNRLPIACAPLIGR